ncbi:condensation domain-containing protein [Dactylosporangium darangshiense]|uniref:condensation domain-containing protein n=1 Tax=Dactylosporangium darangshiense TaxID=579108 RepID=UPI003630B4E2
MDQQSIAFSTGRAGEGPLIWAQLAIWDVFRWLPPDDTTLNLLVTCPVPAGRELPAVLDALRRLVERHDSLHTVYVDTPDGPRQRVVPEGEVPLRLHDLDDLGDVGLEEAAGEIGEALRRPWFDIGADLPLRAAVLLRAGEPLLVLLAASHMAVDGSSLDIVRGDLANLLADPPIVLEPGQQPLERGEYERSDLGRRREAKALAFWARHLDTLPISMIERVRGDGPPNLDWGLIQSPALALAANSLAARHGIPPATALLGGTTLQLAAYTGEDDAALRMIVSTRFRQASRGVVAAFNENALFRLECPPDLRRTETVEQLLRRCADAALAAYLHCEYDPRALEALFADLGRRRGVTPDGYCFFNDTRFGARDTPRWPRCRTRAGRAGRRPAAGDQAALAGDRPAAEGRQLLHVPHGPGRDGRDHAVRRARLLRPPRTAGLPDRPGTPGRPGRAGHDGDHGRAVRRGAIEPAVR